MITTPRTETLSIYFPKGTQEQKPYERLQRMAKKRDRSINYLIVAAIMEHLEREEQKG